MSKKFGLTGGIGCGKSTVADMFGQYDDIGVINCDAIAKEIMGDPEMVSRIAGLAAHDAIDILTQSGTLDFSKLASIFFATPSLRSEIEGWVHPRVWKKIDEMVEADTTRRFWIVESAIIYETNSEREFSDVICVTCSDENQVVRLQQRGYSPEEIVARISSQQSNFFKMMRSRFEIKTDA